MKKALIISAVVLIIGAGVFLYVRKQKRLLEDTTFDVDQVRFEKINQGTVTAYVDLMVTNKSDIAYGVTNATVEAYVNGVKVGEAKTDQRYDVPAHGRVKASIKAVVDLKQITGNAGDIFSAALGSKDVMVQLKMNIGVVKAGIPISVPYTYSVSVRELLNA